MEGTHLRNRNNNKHAQQAQKTLRFKEQIESAWTINKKKIFCVKEGKEFQELLWILLPHRQFRSSFSFLWQNIKRFRFAAKEPFLSSSWSFALFVPEKKFSALDAQTLNKRHRVSTKLAKTIHSEQVSVKYNYRFTLWMHRFVALSL